MSFRRFAPLNDLEYDVDGYGEMIADPVRMGAYERALRATVRPGAVVLDIGTGTGILAVLACRLGARKVYALEPSPVLQLAREVAAANNCAERIEFRQALSTEIELPEPADVIVSDLRGVLPFHGAHLAAIADARRRHLAPGGTMIPRADSLWLALVEAPEVHRRVREPWAENSFGLDMQAGSALAANTWTRCVVRPSQLLSAPAHCGALDYTRLSPGPFAAEVAVQATRAGRAHGFCLWFDAVLAEGVGFSNAPGQPELIYGSACFRWPEEIAVDAGDSVNIGLRADFIAGRHEWAWSSVVRAGSEAARVKARFRQSTFLGRPMTLESLRRKAEDHVPALGEAGQVDLMILQQMAAQEPLGKIARALARQFPDRFARWQDALERVGEVSSRYGR